MEKLKRHKEENKRRQEERARMEDRRSIGMQRHYGQYDDKFKSTLYDFSAYDNLARLNDELPTINDFVDTDNTAEYLSLEESRARQNGILEAINDLDQMLKLGKMAIDQPDQLYKMLALPSFLESRQIIKEANLGQSKFNHFI